jgi:hypothetical protein
MPPRSKRLLPGKRYPLNMRTTKELRDRVDEAAMASGRSLVQEVEFRLENSFREDDLYGGPHLSALFRLLAARKALAEAKEGASWTESDRVRNEIAQAFAELLVKELPRFHSVTIETVDQHGGISGVTSYASDEARERDNPGIAEILRMRREAAALRGEQPATDKKEGGSK